MKEIIALSEFRKDKHEAENAVTKILNDFSLKYHCGLKVDVDVIATDQIAVGKTFIYQAYLSATF